ncbi:MAG: Na+/H+ antiporter NhaA, partial [Rhizobiales bacterium]|nr:Na+/H+ antiporter NhaA [Hyphomicrobiales bacterium]
MSQEPLPVAKRTWLQSPVDVARDHVRGDPNDARAITVVLYGDYLCPYCRRLRPILARLRETLGDRFVYVFRHSPNETVHPGAEEISRIAEAAGKQGFFWPMHDWLYEAERPQTPRDAIAYAEALGLDMARLRQDVDSAETRTHVEEDIAQGRANGVTETPTIFVDGLRYDGAWDFHSLLEALQRPVAQRLERSARAFASLPASGGIALLVAAAVALVCANTLLAPYYFALIEASFGLGPPGAALSLTIAEWCSEGLLAIFFLLVGLEIRREMTKGALAEWRAALLPAIGALGGVIAPAAIYLAFNSGPAAPGWSVPTATDIAFTLGILAILGPRIPQSLRVFVAALAVVDDVLSVLTLAIFYSHGFALQWLVASIAGIVALFALNRWKVYSVWPYVVVSVALWVCLHLAGIHGALAGVIMAALLPDRPDPAVSPLLAQAATALEALENAERRQRPEAEREA